MTKPLPLWVDFLAGAAVVFGGWALVILITIIFGGGR